MTDKLRFEMNRFFADDDVREAVESEDIAYIYNKFEHKFIYTQPLTQFFREIDFDPLPHVKAIHCGMYIREMTPETFVIPEGVECIKILAFHQCPNLSVIHIPKSVVVIDREAFSDCKNLHTIIYGGTQEDWINIHMKKDTFRAVNIETIQCTDGLFER